MQTTSECKTYMKKLGIIAAKGDLSKTLINFAKLRYEIFIVGVKNEADPILLEEFNHIWISLGEIGKAVDAFNDNKIKDIVFVGSLKKPDIFNLKLDSLGKKLLARIVKDKFFGDNEILSSLTKFLEELGLKVYGAHELIKDLAVSEQLFTETKPNQADLNDIELAKKVVNELGKLDIGQAVIVQNGVVLGVEAIEGTDRLIKRCGEMKFSTDHSGVLLKFSKPNQELRMDLPTIGIQTIKNMHEAGFKGIVIEAERTIFLDKEECITCANLHNMFILSL
jgi:UDP-2,3-diacylglucosamine hydrolase